MNDDETFVSFADNVAALRDLGVPEQVVGYVAAQKYPKSWQRRSAWFTLLMGLGIFGSIAVSFAALFVLAHHLDDHRARDALFHYSNHGWAGLPLLFALILTIGAGINAATLRRNPRSVEFHTIRGMVWAAPQYKSISVPISRWMMRKRSGCPPSSAPRTYGAAGVRSPAKSAAARPQGGTAECRA